MKNLWDSPTPKPGKGSSTLKCRELHSDSAAGQLFQQRGRATEIQSPGEARMKHPADVTLCALPAPTDSVPAYL